MNWRWAIPVLFCLSASTAGARELQPVDIAIVVSLDRSESINADEAAVQIEGLVYALRDSRFREAATVGPFGRIALSVVTWSSFGRHQVVLPWVQIAGPEDADLAALAIERDLTGRYAVRDGSQTDTAFAIEIGLKQIDALPWPASQRVINVVSDGISNIGRLASVDRDVAVRRGVTVNGLIMGRGSAIEVLTRYFRREVIGGPTAFLQVSASRQDFATAMLKKMLLEMVRLRLPQAPNDEPPGWVEQAYWSPATDFPHAVVQ